MSSNISKKKKQNLLKKISILKDFISKNTNDPTLIEYLLEIKEEINEKRYGLLFEEHIEENINTNNIILSEVKELSIDVGGNENILIEGENLAALKVLEQ